MTQPKWEVKAALIALAAFKMEGNYAAFSQIIYKGCKEIDSEAFQKGKDAAVDYVNMNVYGPVKVTDDAVLFTQDHAEFTKVLESARNLPEGE